MKASLTWLGAFLGAGLVASLATAGPPGYACHPQAPDACGPGSYATNECGAYYGPNYNVRPAGAPFTMPPFPPTASGRGRGRGARGPQAIGSPNFPTHPYARSPRDFFMLD
jgi:hypothetical protein